MALRVVSENLTDRSGVIVVEGKSQDEVLSPAARQLVIQTGARQVSRCGISSQAHAYPVDAQGHTSEDLIMGRGGAVFAYRADYTVAGGL